MGADVLSVEHELFLGLGPENAMLRLPLEARVLDLQPWLLDCVAVRLSCLGHQEEIPRSWDWENVLTLLEPGEELLYVLDHIRSHGEQTGRPFSLWLALRFPRQERLSAHELDRRRKRARMLVSHFQRQAFPGTDLEWVDPGQLPALLHFETGSQHCVCVSGLPSPRNLDDQQHQVERAPASRNYQSLNDVADSLIDLGCDYRIAFVVERVDSGVLKDRLGQATQLLDAIHPFVRASTQEGGSHGSSLQRQSSVSDGTSWTSEETNRGGWLKNLVDNVKNVTLHPWSSGSQPETSLVSRGTASAALGLAADRREWTRGLSRSVAESRTTAEGEVTGETVDQSWNVSRERVRSMLELADRSLERTIAALHEAHGTGGYRWSAFVFADGQNAQLIGGALVSVLAGSRTKDYPFNRFEVVGAGSALFLGTEPLLDLVAEAAPIVSLPRACEALLLPEAELSGLRLRRNVFLGRACRPQDDDQPKVALGPDAFSALTGAEFPDSIEIRRQDLFRHILVAGATGAGKTTRVVEILSRIQDDLLSIVVFETAKRTYRASLQRGGRAPLVYSLGSSREFSSSRFRPLRVNPFFFELGTSLKRHIAVLSDALAELMPTEAMIGPLMRRAVEATYLERGWDIETGQPLQGDATWPGVLDFVAQVREIARDLKYGPEVTANYRGALENRASLFVDATFQDIFSHGGNVPIAELFPLGRDAIIEVEDLPPSEVDIRAFVMTILLSRLRSVQAFLGAGAESRRWLVVVEEAHNVLDRSFEVRRPADESNAGRTLLRCIDRLLQEGRESRIGVMVVDQSPVSLARSVISNTGTKIVMRLEDGAEMEEIGRALGLDEESWKKLGYLQEGEAIIKASYMDSPVKTSPFKHRGQGPVDIAPLGTGWAPSYRALEKLWQPALEGRRTPDSEWLKELLDASNGKVELAGFVGARLQLDMASDDLAAESPPALRHALAQREALPEALLDAVRQIHLSMVVRDHAPEFVALLRLKFRALVGSLGVENRGRVAVKVLQRAARILAHMQIGEEERWSALLLRLAGCRAEALAAACQEYAQYSEVVGRGDQTAPIRALLVSCAEQERSACFMAASAAEFDPIELVRQVDSLIEPLVEPSEGESAEARSRRQVFSQHLGEQLAIDFVSKFGSMDRVSLILGLV